MLRLQESLKLATIVVLVTVGVHHAVDIVHSDPHNAAGGIALVAVAMVLYWSWFWRGRV